MDEPITKGYSEKGTDGIAKWILFSRISIKRQDFQDLGGPPLPFWPHVGEGVWRARSPAHGYPVQSEAECAGDDLQFQYVYQSLCPLNRNGTLSHTPRTGVRPVLQQNLCCVNISP